MPEVVSGVSGSKVAGVLFALIPRMLFPCKSECCSGASGISKGVAFVLIAFFKSKTVHWVVHLLGVKGKQGARGSVALMWKEHE